MGFEADPPAWEITVDSEASVQELEARHPELEEHHFEEEHWSRLVEVSAAQGRGCFTTAVSNLIAAQQRDEPTAWVQLELGGALYPPDLADSGIDLDALLVVQAPSPKAQLRSAELLVRSGAFGLLVLDLTYAGSYAGSTASRDPRSLAAKRAPSRFHRVSDPAWQSRLAALAREHQSRILVISSKADEAPSLGPMVTLRLAPRWERSAPGELLLDQVVLKNKGGGSLPSARASYRTPAGML